MKSEIQELELGLCWGGGLFSNLYSRWLGKHVGSHLQCFFQQALTKQEGRAGIHFTWKQVKEKYSFMQVKSRASAGHGGAEGLPREGNRHLSVLAPQQQGSACGLQPGKQHCHFHCPKPDTWVILDVPISLHVFRVMSSYFSLESFLNSPVSFHPLLLPLLSSHLNCYNSPWLISVST